jgi:hypothetical protein
MENKKPNTRRTYYKFGGQRIINLEATQKKLSVKWIQKYFWIRQSLALGNLF